MTSAIIILISYTVASIISLVTVIGSSYSLIHEAVADARAGYLTIGDAIVTMSYLCMLIVLGFLLTIVIIGFLGPWVS